jgi:hypothetical protein
MFYLVSVTFTIIKRIYMDPTRIGLFKSECYIIF